MPSVPGDESPHLSPATLAGLLLAARPYLDRAGAPVPRAAAILVATGVGKSRAYVERAKVLRALAEDARPLQRELGALSHRTLRFLMDHPDAVRRSNRRRSYSHAFRHFLILLREEHQDIPLLAFARAVDVPLPTLRDWLRQAARSEPASCPDQEHGVVPRAPGERELAAGTGNRPPRTWARHQTCRRYDRALRGSFKTFFPGAQWVSDGTLLSTQVNGQRYDFNLQLTVDTHTAALVGASIRDHEDCQGVIESFRDGTRTTGEPPLFLLLDNRPSNHAARLAGAVHETTVMYARKGRPQNKAHVEGAFGLFSHQVPPIHIEAKEPRELARQVLELVVTTWARTLNHRPRRDRSNRSRVELYRSPHLTAEAGAAAVRAAREYLERRTRPRELSSAQMSRRALVADALARLGLDDSRCRLARAIERCPVDAILAGVATYEAKQAAGTLPAFADREAAGRYLLRIVGNIVEEDEGMRIAETLLRRRRDLHAQLIQTLEERHAALPGDASPKALLELLVAEALRTHDQVERRFWLDASVRAIRDAAAGQAEQEATLYRWAVRSILINTGVPYRERLSLVRVLTAGLLPLA